MGTKKILGTMVLALAASAACFGQGLTDPNRFFSPRLGDPSRLSFAGRDNVNFNVGLSRGQSPQNVRAQSVISVVRQGDPSAVNGGNFGGRGGNSPLNGPDPELIRTFGYNAYASATGVGNRAAGVGTGVGNKFAGLGAYYYGQGAGLGMFASGMGDMYAGQGRMLEGQGAYEQSNSVANINNAEADYRDMKNDEYTASAFFNKRKTNIEARRYEKDMQRYAINRLSTEQLAKLQEQRAPERLGFQQYDETTGALAWPAMLKNPSFAASREQINRLFAMRSRLGGSTGLGSDNYREIRQETEQLENHLREVMPELAPMEYTMAKNFLRSLKYEAQQPMATSFPVARIADAR